MSERHWQVDGRWLRAWADLNWRDGALGVVWSAEDRHVALGIGPLWVGVGTYDRGRLGDDE